MRTTHFTASLMQAVGYLRRHPRVRLVHSACPDHPVEAAFRRSHGRLPGVNYGMLAFRTRGGVRRLWVQGGDAVWSEGHVPRETGVRFEVGGFTVMRGLEGDEDFTWTAVEYLEGPAAVGEG